MKKNQCLTVILALVMMLSCFGVNVSAAEECLGAEETISVVRATGKFDMEVRANRTVKAGSSFPLEVGEVVTIKATYSPFSASVDFGLIAPDGLFYGLNTILSYPIVYWGFILLIIFRTLKEVYYFIKSHERRKL